ncbi:MAG TPA: 4Fe-4S binding protein [Thermodesulfobacteriota bacterium]|nr:4Fe-4S binding protein [Thermodesulfobacteriota bacterium]
MMTPSLAERDWARGKRKAETVIANYGFTDGSGDWYITIDTEKCSGCGNCPEVCPAKILDVGVDEIDIFREKPVAFVKHEERKRIKYRCARCRPGCGAEPAPCVGICEPKAITHSEGWKLQFGSK